MTNEKPTALETRTRSDDARMLSPSVARNKEPVMEVLRPHLGPGMRVLEVASGTGEHAAHITSEIEGLIWHPSDLSPEARTSIAAWAAHTGNTNFHNPVALDATADRWPLEEGMMFDGVVCMNMIHISPVGAARGVIRGAGRLLKPGGFLYFYGPFKQEGVHTAPSNQAFDESLKSRDDAWGIRDVEEISVLCSAAGLVQESLTEMPANNLSLVFRR